MGQDRKSAHSSKLIADSKFQERYLVFELTARSYQLNN